MLAAHSKNLEHSLTHYAASLRPASPTAGRAADKQTEPFQHWGGSFTQEEQRTPTYKLKNIVPLILPSIHKMVI